MFFNYQVDTGIVEVNFNTILKEDPNLDEVYDNLSSRLQDNYIRPSLLAKMKHRAEIILCTRYRGELIFEYNGLRLCIAKQLSGEFPNHFSQYKIGTKYHALGITNSQIEEFYQSFLMTFPTRKPLQATMDRYLRLYLDEHHKNVENRIGSSSFIHTPPQSEYCEHWRGGYHPPPHRPESNHSCILPSTILVLISPEIIFPIKMFGIPQLIERLNAVFHTSWSSRGTDVFANRPANFEQLMVDNFPAEMRGSIQTIQSIVTIAEKELPIFIDYFKETFPLYHPVGRQASMKLRDYLNSLGLQIVRWVVVPDSQILMFSSKDQHMSVKDITNYEDFLITQLPVKPNFGYYLPTITLRNAGKIYRELWNQRVAEPLKRSHILRLLEPYLPPELQNLTVDYFAAELHNQVYHHKIKYQEEVDRLMRKALSTYTVNDVREVISGYLEQPIPYPAFWDNYFTLNNYFKMSITTS